MVTEVVETGAYGRDQVQILEGLNPVRKRPGMYIGTTNKQGYHHLLWEVIDNAVDEAMGGYADSISVTLNPDGSATVTDNGRGIPLEAKETGEQKGVPLVQVVATILHAGAKFDSSAYQFSGGLHGVGLSVVNALSSYMDIEVERDGLVGEIKFHSVEVDGEIQPGVVKEELKTRKGRKTITGTSITFLPDPEVFKSYRAQEWDAKLVSQRLRQAAFLNAGLSFSITDNREGYENISETYLYENGLLDFMEEIKTERLEIDEAEDQPSRKLTTYPGEPILLSGGDAEHESTWEMALEWFPDSQYRVSSYANGIHTVAGGTHVKGFESALTSLLNRYASQEHIGLISPDGWKLEAQDVRSGLGVVLSVRVKDPQFQGQTKDQLSNVETRSMVRRGFSTEFWNWMEENPVKTLTFLEKCVREMEIRRKTYAAEIAAREKAESAAVKAKAYPLPAKLVDSRKRGEGTELFIVEGDSAFGSALPARNPQTQGILPVRGKGLNVEKILSAKGGEERVMNNKEVQDIIASIGAGSQELFNEKDMRYDSVVLLTDADDDGKHIQLLLTALFYRLMPGLIESGHLLIARPPLFSVTTNKGKLYLSDEDELERFLESPKGRNATVGRFKGLGEMNASQLRETTMDPKTRSLVRVTVEDASMADKMISDLLSTKTEYKWELVRELEISLLDD